jgi:hypothetical protein
MGVNNWMQTSRLLFITAFILYRDGLKSKLPPSDAIMIHINYTADKIAVNFKVN